MDLQIIWITCEGIKSFTFFKKTMHVGDSVFTFRLLQWPVPIACSYGDLDFERLCLNGPKHHTVGDWRLEKLDNMHEQLMTPVPGS